MKKTELKRTSLKLPKLVAINALVLLVLLEIMSVGFYYYEMGEFFYARSQDPNGSTRRPFETNFQQGGNDMSLIYQFHPYFGFVYRQGFVQEPFIGAPYRSSYPTNNYGFLSHATYPSRKTNGNQFIIGIFGGSVATMFSFYELEHRVLTEALRRVPYFTDKELIVLNFAAGGYKQPQQLMVLNYFLSVGQELDMVINIDGVNETEFWNNRFGVEVSMPLVHVSLPLADLADKDLSPEQLELSLEILQIKEKLREAEAQLERCRFATRYALTFLKLKYLQTQYRDKSEAFAGIKRTGKGKDSLIYLNRVEKPLDASAAYEQMADVWANSSLAMKEVLSAKNARYFHFIQPNQYFPTKREFSDEEQRIAIDQGNPIQESVTNAYPRLLSRIDGLQRSGVDVFSAVTAFDEVRDIVYVDNTCHYNERGNEALANYIARCITGKFR